MSRPTSVRAHRRTAAAVLTGLGAPLLLALPAVAAPAAEGTSPSATYIVRAQAGALAQVQSAVESLGGRVTRPVPLIDGVLVHLPRGGADALTRRPGVLAVTPDGTLTASADEYDASLDSYSLARAEQIGGVRSAWQAGVTGAGVTVAVLDSGVSRVPGLDGVGKVTDGIDLSFEAVDGDKKNVDLYGHGTHLAGIIAGDDAKSDRTKRDGKSFVGVAPDAKIVNVKLGDGDGHVDVSQVIAGLDWVVANQAKTGIRVVNLSFNAGGLQSYTLDPLSFAAEQAWKRGVVVVISAGNDGSGPGHLMNPARDPFILAVGAVDDRGTTDRTDDSVPAFSARGDGIRNPDVLAPGRSMQSLMAPGSHVAKSAYATKLGTRFVRASGTSQAAAYASGVAALLLSHRPSLTPDQVKYLLTSTAYDVNGAPATAQGNGAIDVLAALAAPVPTAAQATQRHEPSTGLGTLDASRGTQALVLPDGRLLQGEVDAWGRSFDAQAHADLLLSGDTATLAASVPVVKGTWSGATWSGATWSGATWSGATWSGATWSGATWSGATWSGATWSGATWSGATWSSGGWQSRSWR